MGLNINPQAAITPGGVNQSLAGLAGVLAGLPAKRREQAIEQQHLELQKQGLANQLAQRQAEAEHWKAVLDEQHQYHASAEAERQARAQLEQARTGALWLKGLGGMLGLGGKQMTPKDQAEIDHLNAQTEAIKAGKPAKPNDDLAPAELVNGVEKGWRDQEIEDRTRAESVKGGRYVPAPGRADQYKAVKLKAAGYDPQTLRKLTPQTPAAPSPSAAPNPDPGGMGAGAPAGQGTPSGTGAPPAQAAPAAGLRAKITAKFGGTVPPAVETYLKHAEAGNAQAAQALTSKYGE